MAEVAVFDVNETMLDLAPVRAEIDDLVGLEGGSAAWFARLLQLAMTTTATGGFVDFTTLGRDSLQAVAATGGRRLADGSWERVAAAMGEVRAHPDVAPGLDRLGAAGWTLVALTNSTRATLEAQLAGAGLADRFDHIISVDAVGAYKPFAAPYRHALELARTTAGEAWMVACHDWDLAGAAAVGMATAFITRPGRSSAASYPSPDMTVADFAELAQALVD